MSGLLLQISGDKAGPTPVEIDYSGFRNAYGGDWATRLRLVNTATGEAVPSRNDPATGVLRADVVLPEPAGSVDRADRTQSVDRMSCKDDGQAGSEELCFASNNAVVMLPGLAGELVRDDTTGQWRVEDDDGWRVELLTGASNGDNDGEHWRLTSPDGTQYFFGRNRLPGWTTGKAETNSTLTVPVYGDDPGEPCHGATFANSWCRQAYRWNVDYVVDTHGDAMSQFYGKESNHYNRGGTVTSYDRSGYLTRIDYGQRADTLFTVAATGQVEFTAAERCVPGTSCGKTQPQNAPDVPWDQHCEATVCTVTTPTFWSSKRLSKITTRVFHDNAYRDVNSWEFVHSFPATGDATSPTLWLDRLVRTGHLGGAVSLPPVTFDGVQRENRVVAIGGAPPMNKWRVAMITSETGGQARVSYTSKQCAANSLPSPETNATHPSQGVSISHTEPGEPQRRSHRDRDDERAEPE